MSLPRRVIDLTGQRFGRLTVIAFVERKNKTTRWQCVCECGTAVVVTSASLRKGATKSCGCYHRDMTAISHTTHGQTKGGARPHNYNLWGAIRRLTLTCISGPTYDQYKGRGISMYPPWREDCLAFDRWVKENLGDCPDGCSLDRIDNNGNYEPGNLRWATPVEQGNNRRCNVLVSYAGATRSVSQWADITGIASRTLHNRLFRGSWPVEKALSAPVAKRKKHDN